MKIYISSTYQDLIDYRAAVDRTLRRMGHDIIGMEQYVAEGSKPIDRCRADVRTADIYVIIVAWRYGYVPFQIDSQPNTRSITEIEFEEAKLHGKTILAFLLDPDAPWPPSRVDAMASLKREGEDVARLRSSLGSNYMAGIFRTPDDLASQVAAAVSAQGLTRHMVDRVLGETSVAPPGMEAFSQGSSLNDSTLITIKAMIKSAGTASAIVLPIDDGERWWSTRLFLLSSLLHALTGVKQLVFCGYDGRFLGMASPVAIMDGLANTFADLADIARELRKDISLDIERETDRQINLWQNNLTNFLPPGTPAGQSRESLIKVGVRGQLLQTWLGERWTSRCIEIDNHELNMSQVQQIVDSLLPNVPVQRRMKPPEEGFSLLVVDRDAFALRLAREWVRSGLPRSPVL